jgi:uncharacterized NAD(P)/FAD-binding protein YdhS
MNMRPEVGKHQLGETCPSCPGPAPRASKVAIIGGGFSGTIVLANLVANARPGTIEIDMFEARGKFGPGTAYETREGTHLLNVHVARMGATSPEDFHRWLQTARGREASREIWPERMVEATDYAPRALYGHYLKDLLAETLESARQRHIRVRLHHDVVRDVFPRKDGAGLVIMSDWMRSEADAVVLATGNLPPRPLAALGFVARRSSRYVGTVWHADIARRVGTLPRQSDILIFGTGLTAVDNILSLRARGFDGRIIAISRHGRLPLAHKVEARVPWTLTIPPDDVAPTAGALLAWLRREARLAEAEGVGWRSVLDAVRPFTQRLWRALNASERLKLLRAHSFWNIHRHRMAPEAHAAIENLRETGRLELRAARCLSVKRRIGGFAVRLRGKGAAADETIRPALILNCTGPEHDVAECNDPLLKNLLRRGLVMRSPAGGITTRQGVVADGRNGARIFAVGPLLIGEIFETTAVPELRELAKHVAGLVQARLS